MSSLAAQALSDRPDGPWRTQRCWNYPGTIGCPLQLSTDRGIDAGCGFGLFSEGLPLQQVPGVGVERAFAAKRRLAFGLCQRSSRGHGGGCSENIAAFLAIQECRAYDRRSSQDEMSKVVHD